MGMGRSKQFLALAAGLIVSACAAGPDYKAPVMGAGGTYSSGHTGSIGDISARAWWQSFGDRQLDGLVAVGLSRNLDILEALELVQQARQNVVAEQGNFLPSISASGSATESFGVSGRSREAAGALSASWVIDLFGQYRRRSEGARASLDAAYSSANVARLTLISDLVSHYVDARYYQELISISQAALAVRQKTLELTRVRQRAGASSQLDVTQAEGLVNTLRAETPRHEARFREAVYRLSTLTGSQATSLVGVLEAAAGQPVPKDPVATGIPADLIRNRPDIRRAERELAAATAEIGVARAQLYPSLKLNGSISPTAVLAAAVAPSLTAWSFGPTLDIPVFKGGALQANVKIAESRARAAYLNWKKTILTAVEEVESALVAYSRDRQVVEARAAEVKSYERALALSKNAYSKGVVSLLNVLDNQRSVAEARQNMAEAVRQAALDYVKLNVALGGGYAAWSVGG